MSRIIYILVCLCLFLSCSNGNKNAKSIEEAKSLMCSRPDSSLAILKAMEGDIEHFNTSLRMQYLLYLTDAKNKNFIDFTSDSITTELVKYFDKNGTKEEKMLAHYLQGRALADMGESPEAIQEYCNALNYADTVNCTKGTYSLNTLIGIYGQMSAVFHKQNLPNDEIWAIKKYIDCVKLTGDSIRYYGEKTQLIRPLFLLGKKDTILSIINDSYNSLDKLGYHKDAAELLTYPIFIHLERHETKKAKELMDIFEHQSGLFDKNGNIKKGREHYYFSKGTYELQVGKTDSAEYYFRKLMPYSTDAYHGMMLVYQNKRNIDSVIYYSSLREASLDSLHNEMQIDAVHQTAALYNYERSQKIAASEKAKAQRAKNTTINCIVVAFILVLLLSIYFYSYQKKKKEKIHELEKSLYSAKLQKTEIQEDLQRLRAKDYESLIKSKETKVQELKTVISDLQKKQNISAEIDQLNDFINSKIAQLFYKKAAHKTERFIPNEAEWELLLREFYKFMPAAYERFCIKGALSTLELRTTILLILNFPEGVIAKITESSSPAISTAKARANYKLFKKREASSFRRNLISSLNTD